MVVSLNSVVTFNPTANYQLATKPSNRTRTLPLKVPSITSLSQPLKLNGRISRSHHLLAAGGDNAITEATEKDFKPVQGPASNDGPSSNFTPNINPLPTDNQIQHKNESFQSSSGLISPDLSPSTPNPDLILKRAPLTARERLRAARVLSRYSDSKPAKTKLGGNLLQALRESDNRVNKKQSGLPEAPTNLFDDSKRGLPKEGWTINLPGGMDAFFIVLSFVLISTVMFVTTYVVWKVGAIHFNEY